MQIVSMWRSGWRGWGTTASTPGPLGRRALPLIRGGAVQVDRSSSTHVVDASVLTKSRWALRPPARGAVTVRTAGKSGSGLYLREASASLAHTVVGQVTHGIGSCGLPRRRSLAIRAEPENRPIGLSLAEAEAVTARREISLTADEAGGDRVVSQTPATLEVLAGARFRSQRVTR